MVHLGLGFEKTLSFISSKRRTVCPNEGFRQQLKQFEDSPEFHTLEKELSKQVEWNEAIRQQDLGMVLSEMAMSPRTRLLPLPARSELKSLATPPQRQVKTENFCGIKALPHRHERRLPRHECGKTTESMGLIRRLPCPAEPCGLVTTKGTEASPGKVRPVTCQASHFRCLDEAGDVPNLVCSRRAASLIPLQGREQFVCKSRGPRQTCMTRQIELAGSLSCEPCRGM